MSWGKGTVQRAWAVCEMLHGKLGQGELGLDLVYSKLFTLNKLKLDPNQADFLLWDASFCILLHVLGGSGE